jgi:hypothetical protein
MGQRKISQGLTSERSSVSYTKNPMRGTAVVGKAEAREAQTVALLEMGVSCSSSLTRGPYKPVLCACPLLSSSGLMGHGQRLACVCRDTVRTFYRAVSDRIPGSGW